MKGTLKGSYCIKTLHKDTHAYCSQYVNFVDIQEDHVLVI